MADTQDMGEVVDEPIEATLLPIPEDQLDRALAAILALDAGAEVAGYAVGRPVMSGASSGTGCKITGTDDFKCTDSDRR